MQKRIGVLIYSGVQALDVAGPMDAFAAAELRNQPGRRMSAYDVFAVSTSLRAVVAESGLHLKARFRLEECPPLDTLIIPGGAALRDPQVAAQLAPWIARSAARARRVAAICTGTFGLAATGLLRNRRVTTHWRYAKALADRHPELQVTADALYIKDGRYYTSAGITAGIDLALALIEEDFGRTVSVRVARELVVYLRRAGGQSQYSEPLEFEARSLDRFSDVAQWVVANLHRPITLEDLARRTSLGSRQLTRRFKESFGTTPVHFVQHLRMKEAQRRLIMTETPVKRLAQSLGYRSPHVFRKAFERAFGLAPVVYRQRFGAAR